MPRPPRSPYTPEDRQRALTALYASGDEVDGEWCPNFFAVSKMDGMPTPTTLSKWWSERDGRQDCKHLEAAQRAREQARKQGAEDFFHHTLSALQEGVRWVLDPEHRQKEPRISHLTGEVIKDQDGEAVMLYVNRPDHMSRAYKDAAQTIEKVRALLVPLQQPEEPTSSPAEDEAAALELLTRSPHILARALAALPAEAQAAVITRAQQQEE